MEFKFTFKHLEALKSITDYAQGRFEKIDKFSMGKEMNIHFIFSVQREDQTCEVLIDYGNNHYTATAKDPTLYTAIDKAVDKVERQLLKHKEKVQHHHNFAESNEGYLRQEIAEQAKSLRVDEDYVAPRQNSAKRRA